MLEFDRAWQRAQYDAGWAGINWPVEFGGRGLSLLQQMIWFEESARAGSPWIGACFVGINHAGPTLIARGTDAQKARHLSAILRAGEIWCQGFSEPGAGSDLAGLSTRGVIDGDDLVVNGQKIWTSFAEHADYCELLVRTSRTGKRHEGITWVICDMRAAGITIRPIENLNRVYEQCEVFYDDVRVPLANVVGHLGDGWSVAMSTLSFERGTGFMKAQVELARRVDALIEEARVRVDHRGRAWLADEAVATRLATARAECAALRAMTLANISRGANRAQPGAEGSFTRLFCGELSQRVHRLAVDIAGADALEERTEGHPDAWSQNWYRGFAETIAAGSKDIQRNIIGERVLGLPRGR
jgi:alkylation response protein AidB-like acyl-CoA dehydrogenase